MTAIAIATAIVGGLAGGWLTDRIGPGRTLNIFLYLWMATMTIGIVAAVANQQTVAFAVGGLGGIALGGTWASDRVYMARISPPAHLGEFYGLYSTVGRFATVLGPLVWGVVVSVLGLPRIVALGALLVFVVAGRLTLTRVDDTPRRWQGSDRFDYDASTTSGGASAPTDP